jgi:hypothetical protein
MRTDWEIQIKKKADQRWERILRNDIQNFSADIFTNGLIKTGKIAYGRFGKTKSCS